jgi:hypothetical protein
VSAVLVFLVTILRVLEFIAVAEPQALRGHERNNCRRPIHVTKMGTN